MKLPRRVPWASLAELDQVCSWIYGDENDIESKILAANRLTAWRAITPLPHALEAVLSLLSSVLLDRQCTFAPHPSSSVFARNGSTLLNVRQSYSAAIIRLVNGLVDPLQLGTYARSIASIAAQIGLPLWLVELRHATTHEEMPSLELLRSGATEALTWLLHNYFIPTLSAPSDSYQATPTSTLPPLTPFLKQYKGILKATSRDASLKSQYMMELTRTLRDIERWIGEAKVAASQVIFSGWGSSEGSDGDDDNERWALDRVCEALMARGGLVPVSSKKRLVSKSKASPRLPPALIAVWSPLLQNLQFHHPLLPSALVSAIVNYLLAPKDGTTGKIDLSYDLCLAAWAAWCVQRWGSSSNSERETEDTSILKKEEVIIGVITTLGTIIESDDSESIQGARSLVSQLVQDDLELKETVDSLLSTTRGKGLTAQTWADQDTRVMEERLKSFLLSTSQVLLKNGDDRHMEVDEPRQRPLCIHDVDLPVGWSTVSDAVWRPCPLGVLEA